MKSQLSNFAILIMVCIDLSSSTHKEITNDTMATILSVIAILWTKFHRLSTTETEIVLIDYII